MRQLLREHPQIRRNIIEFPELFANCRVIKLERNYRSTQPILERQYDDHPRRQPDLDVLQSVAARHNTLEEPLTDLTLEPHQAEERVDEGALLPG